jgi:hypothetical protein
MTDLMFVGEATRELLAQYGIAARPQDLSNLLYRRALPTELCPLVGNRRVIPRDVLPLIASCLRARGFTGACGERA